MPKIKKDEINELLELKPDDVANLTYEESMELLERVVAALEQDGTPLQMGGRLYELGTMLARKCGQILDQTEEKMMQLLGNVENPSEEPFDPEKDGR
ncbi:MAG: exodeoxyribonuclease VII small subunit [Candidatus Riflebacteria bacterium]